MSPKFPQEAKIFIITRTNRSRITYRNTSSSARVISNSWRRTGRGRASAKLYYPTLRLFLPLVILLVCQLVSTLLAYKSEDDGVSKKSMANKGIAPHHSYSLNNRGFVPNEPAAVIERRFGERTSSATLERLREAVTVGPHTRSWRRSGFGILPEKQPKDWSQPDPRKTYSLPYSSSSLGAFDNSRARNLGIRRASGDISLGLTRSILQQPNKNNNNKVSNNSSSGRLDLSTVRRGGGGGGGVPETVTLIRYVPVLFSVPVGEQLQHQQAALISQPISSSRSIQQHPHHSTSGLSGAYRWTSNSDMSNPQFSLESAPEVSSLEPLNGAQPFRTAYIAPQIHIPQVSRPVALSAYASRLMSMLRPSALFASINSVAPIQQMMSPSAQQQSSGGQRAAAVYLLAPSESSALAASPLASPSLLRGVSSLDTEQGGVARSVVPFTSWAHQQPNGLICVHSLLQELPLPSSSQHQQQVVTSSGPAIDSSFEYLASGTESSAQSPPSESHQQQQQGKFSSLTSSTAIPFVATSTTQLSTSNPPTSTAVPPERRRSRQQASGSSSASTGQETLRLDLQARPTIIPFTIRDKIERPADGTRLPTPSFVQFDETEDSSAVDLAPTSFASSFALGRPQTSNGSRTTSFKSSGRPEIDYSRELFSSSLPLLMASSTKSRGTSRSHDSPASSSRRGKLVAPAEYYRAAASSREHHAAEPITTSSSTESALYAPPPPPPPPSSTVSTRSTLDGEPVQLPSGSLRTEGVAGLSRAGGNSSRSAAANQSRIKDATFTSDDRGHQMTRLDNSSSSSDLREEQYRSSNSRLLESLDNSMEEFARMSAALQTNPMDLIDLQNSRSSFSLPAQLESLSMLSPASMLASSSLSNNLAEYTPVIQPVKHQPSAGKKARRP